MIGRPRRREDLLIREVEDELLVYDPRSGETFLLNETAATIFDLLDGQTPIPLIAQEVLAVLPADPEIVRADVEGIIVQFREKGLVEDGP